MIAGLISPAVESPGQESDNDSLPGKGSYTSSHASSDDEQPGILLLDDSTSSSHANQRRQASHPSDARCRSTHSDPTAKDPGNIALSLIAAPCERPRCACDPQPLKSVEFIQRSWHARQKNDMRNLSDPLLLEMLKIRITPREQRLHGSASI